jgi:hypothetical protein
MQFKNMPFKFDTSHDSTTSPGYIDFPLFTALDRVSLISTWQAVNIIL